MQTTNIKSQNQSEFGKVLRGYLGFLIGTGKSPLTRKCYAGDLSLFQEFLKKRKIDFFDFAARDFDAYDFYLKERGLKANTRRRKLLTARALYRYAVTRKKIAVSPAQFLKAPERVEKTPWIPSAAEYNKILAKLAGTNALVVRNRLIVRLLAETGISLSELCALEWNDLKGATVKVRGKRARSVALSKPLIQDFAVWKKMHKGKSVFPGFNRHGITSMRMTHRGVEVMMRSLSRRAGVPKLNPKSLRHYTVLAWLKKGVSEVEIRNRIGLSSQYSFFLYDRYRSVKR